MSVNFSLSNKAAQKTLDSLILRLKFKESDGWLLAHEFNNINGPSGALRRASDTMRVYGAFGTWQHPAKSGSKRFIPLVYIATADNDDIARDQVHRKVWSQGLVPLLLICTPEKVLLSEGYGFSREDWNKSIKQFTLEELANPNFIDLDRLSAHKLLSSLSWRDFAINPNDRVDKRLLSTLEALSDYLVLSSNASIRAANSLIGRFLYFYMLLDRHLIDEKWLMKINANQTFDTRSTYMSAQLVWAVFDELDKLLNGSIFPLTNIERNCFTDENVNLLRNCIKFGDELNAGGIQLSFIDFDLSSLQTETLSAIYEQFLESEDSDGKRKTGAFYTPPYLADFLLDRVEDEEPLIPGVKLIDCTAGSGVFVVGAFRRLIEQSLIRNAKSTLSAAQIRKLLTDSIFAIEKNPSAHAVTTFSLYLTMLDYVQQEDIDLCLEGNSDQPLFPSLKNNIVCMDVFSKKAQRWVSGFQILIGNPPWQKIDQVTSNLYEIRSRFSKFVDMEEAAEYALWLGLKHFVAEKGLVALVLPTKSFVGPSANRFPNELVSKVEIVGIANFSNLRYELFSHARQAAATVLLRNNLPNRKSTFWTYTPTKAHFPGPIKSSPWLINFDRSQIERFNQRELSTNRSSLFELLMLRPIDRYIKRYIKDSVDLNKITSLKQLFEKEGVEVSRGGSSEQTGLSTELLYGADKYKSNNFRLAPGITLIDVNQPSELLPKIDQAYDFGWMADVKEGFKRRFEGNALIVPRSMQGVAYAELPFAFNSSLNVFYFKRPAGSDDEKLKREQFLKFIGAFLESKLASYLFAITGSLWILDHTRIEKNDLLELPIPIGNIDNVFIKNYLAASEAERLQLVCSKMGFDDWLIKVVNEYNHFRCDFEDGGIPHSFYQIPSEKDIEEYTSTLKLAVRPISDRSNFPEIKVSPKLVESREFIVSITLGETAHQNTLAADRLEAIDIRSGIADFSDSSALTSYDNDAFITLRKPAEKFRWTMESAFADGSILMQRLLESPRG